VASLEEIDRGARLDEKENLRRFFDGSKIGERLRNAIVQNGKVLALKPFHELAMSIRNDNADIDTVDAAANGLGGVL